MVNEQIYEELSIIHKIYYRGLMSNASRWKRELLWVVTSFFVICLSFALLGQSSADVATTIEKTNTAVVDIEKASQLINSMPVAIDADVEATELVVDGEHIAYFKTRLEADKALIALKNNYRTKSNTPERVSFVEKVEVIEGKVSIYDFDNYMTTEKAVEYLSTGSLETQIYTVVKGDNLYDIAKDNNLTEENIYQANPELDENKYLQIGQELRLLVPKPLLNVKIVKTATLVEDIDFEVEEQKDDSIYEGRSKVLKAGILGKQKVKATITTVNGKEVKRDVLHSEVLQEPSAELLAVGTKVRPKSGPTGEFICPLTSYIVTAPFGQRRYSHVHKGVDMALPVGSSVKASDGGTVTFAGYKGSFGYLVIIDHGNGLESYYAHLNSIDVNVGEVVGQGEVIAYSGNTGRSTGPHLHFEMRLYGTAVNPANYVKIPGLN